MAITLGAEHIYREGSQVDTIESTLASAEGSIATLEGTVNTEGSVRYLINENAKDAKYSEATTAYVEKEGNPEVGDYYINNEEYVEVTSENIGDIPEGTQVYTAVITNAKTIAQAIAANSADIIALDTRITSLEDTRTTLLGNNTVTGSIDNRIKTQAGDATTQLTVGGENTTITAAIQSLQSQLSNSNK
jgi:hypothetical protein